MSPAPTDASELRDQLRTAGQRREELRRAWDAARNPELMQLAVHTIPQLLRAERCGLFVCSVDRTRAWLVAGSRLEERQIDVSLVDTMVGKAVSTGTMVFRHPEPGSVRPPSGTEQQTKFAVQSAMTLPLRRVDGTAVIGAVQVLNQIDGCGFGPHDEEALRDIVFFLQPALERIFDEQRMLAEADALDERIAGLDVLESSLRSDNQMRIFSPSLTDSDGQWLHHRWQGKRYPPFILPEATAALCEAWDTTADDVFIATHQKVGTHLTKKFVLEVLRAIHEFPVGHPYRSGDIGHRTVPWPEVLLSQHGRTAWKTFLSRTAGHPRLWYLHNAVEDMPTRHIHPRSRFIVTVRDPRGAAVSQYHFWRRHPLLRVDPQITMAAFVERFVEGDLYFGDYHQHVLGWVRRLPPTIRPEQVLVLRYEDLVEEKLASVQRIARFLAPTMQLSEDRVAQIAASTDFQTMKQEMTVRPGSFHFNPKVFFRSGRSRGWQQELSPQLAARIADKSRRLWGGSELSCPPEAFPE